MEKPATELLSKNPQAWIKANFGKIIVAVLVLVVVIELILGARSFLSPQNIKNSSIPVKQISPLQKAQLSLVTDKSVFKVGETVPVEVKLYTGGHTTGSTDIVIKYDPQFLVLEDQGGIIPGKIYPQYPALEVMKDKGLIGISGYNPEKGGMFSGVGSFATLNFKALKEGKTPLTIDFQEGSTSDSNVVLSDSAEDILGSVLNTDINISSSLAETSVKSAASCGSFSQECQDGQGRAGTQLCTSGSINSGVCGYDAKLTVSCDVCKTQ